MMKMRKSVALALASVLAIGTLMTGCHGSEERLEFVVPETFDTAAKHEITFWAKNDTNKTQTRIYEKAISDFEALYPNIKVNMRLYTDYGKIYNDVITNIATNTTPNVCITYPDHIATYMTGNNAVVAMDELFVDEKYGLGGSEVLFDSPKVDEISAEVKSCSTRRRLMRSSRNTLTSARLEIIIMRFPTCGRRRPAMSTRHLLKRWAMSFRM